MLETSSSKATVLSSGSTKLSIGRIVWQALIGSERRKLFLIWLLIIAGMVIEMLSLGLVFPLVALLVKSDYHEQFPWLYQFFGDPTQKQMLVGGAVALVVIFTFKNIFLYYSNRMQQRFITDASSRISQLVFSQFLSQPYAFHLERNSATLIRNAENSSSIINGGLAPFMVLLTDGLVALGLFVMLMVVEPVGTLCVLLIFGASSIGYQMLTRARIAEWGKLRKHHMRMVLQHLQQGLGGVKEVKILGREREFLAEHERHLAGSMEINRKYLMIQMVPRLWLEVLTTVGLATLVFVMVSTSSDVSSLLPTLGLFAAIAFRVIPSIGRIIASAQTIGFSAPLIRAVHDDLQLTTDCTDPVGAPVVFTKSIEFCDVSFTYASAHRASLEGVSIRINKGEAVGVIGPSGAGKSTLVDVFLGLLSPTSGSVVVDGRAISENIRSWQDQVGYVPQSIYLIDDSLMRNVAFGLATEDIDVSAVEEAIRAAQLEGFVTSLPLGLDTVVGERGVRLSGGQRQRIGIARALYNNPSILVLDEATSSLDVETEHGVMKALKELKGEKTLLVIAHRVSTVSYCSKFFRIEDAHLVPIDHPEVFGAMRQTGD